MSHTLSAQFYLLNPVNLLARLQPEAGRFRRQVGCECYFSSTIRFVSVYSPVASL